MNQNISNAVMASRIEPKNSLDDFPTPSWATRALCEYLIRELNMDLKSQSVWEPTCNRGFMALALEEYFATVHMSDIHDYGIGARVKDFTLDTFDDEPEWPGQVDHIWFNPPFNCALEFILSALQRAGKMVAVFARAVFFEGGERYNALFKNNPPSHIVCFAERVFLQRSKMHRAGTINPETGKPRSTATAYAWFIWQAGDQPATTQTRFDWIPPSRHLLEREGDYEPRGNQ